MSQLYFSYSQPALAAGATHCNTWRRRWFDAAGRTYYSALEFLRDYDLSPVRIDPPKTRTMAAIRRACEATTRALLRSNPRPAKHRAAIRAYQYAMMRAGNDSPHSLSMGDEATRYVTFDTNAEGRSVPRKVHLGGTIHYEIPHWDFVPDEPRLVEDRPTFRAPAHLYSSVSHWQMAA